MLEVQSIDLKYGAAQALRDVSLAAKVGEVTCVLGRNGVGKTSLLRAIVGQQQQLAIGRAMVMRPKLLVLDEPTEGIQPSIIKDIARAIDYLRSTGEMAIVLVEQYFEFARDLADAYTVLDRGQVVLAGKRSEMDEAHVRSHLSV